MKRLPLVLLACLLTATVAAAGAVRVRDACCAESAVTAPDGTGGAFLKLPGIPGGSTNVAHRGEIDVLAYSFGVERAGDPIGGGAVGRATFEALQVETPLDPSTPLLFTRAASGEALASAELTLRRENGFEPLKVRLFGVRVTAFNLTGGEPDVAAPRVAVSLAYARIALDFRPESPEGGPAGPAIHGGWDVVQDRAT